MSEGEEILDTKQLIGFFEEEKKLMALDLHDGPVQLLVGASLQLESINLDSLGDNSKAVARIQQSREMVREAIGTLRVWIDEMQSTLIDADEFHLRLQNLFGVLEKDRIQVSFRFDKRLSELANNVIGNLFRIVQESLNNIVKHSNANRVLILLSVSDEEIRLVVLDNGTEQKVGAPTSKQTNEQFLSAKSIERRCAILKGRSRLYRLTDSADFKGSIENWSSLFLSELTLDEAAELFQAYKNEATIVEVAIPRLGK